MPPFRDLTGQTFNDLTAICREGVGERGNVLWRFRCVCGAEIVHRGSAVSKGEKVSCGCHKERKRVTPRICRTCGGVSVKLNQAGYMGNICHACAAANMKKFLIENPAIYMVNSAKARAKKAGIPFAIKAADITVPEYCPILGMKLARGKIGDRENSPSLDRLIPELGYVPGNVAVISFRANRFKNDAGPEELRLIADWIESKTKIHLVA